MCNLSYYLSGTACLSICPAGFYGDYSDKLCKACNSPCAECVGSTSNDCTNCVANFYLKDNSNIKVCSSDCGDYYF